MCMCVCMVCVPMWARMHARVPDAELRKCLPSGSAWAAIACAGGLASQPRVRKGTHACLGTHTHTYSLGLHGFMSLVPGHVPCNVALAQDHCSPGLPMPTFRDRQSPGTSPAARPCVIAAALCFVRDPLPPWSVAKHANSLPAYFAHFVCVPVCRVCGCAHAGAAEPSAPPASAGAAGPLPGHGAMVRERGLGVCVRVRVHACMLEHVYWQPDPACMEGV